MRTRMSNSLQRIAIGGAILAMTSTTVYAATQGTTGFTSTGDLLITVTVSDEVKISNLVDIDLGGFVGVDLTGTSPACIYRNTGTTYNLTATGSGPANAFQLTDGTDVVAYTVEYDDGTGFSSMATGVALGADNAEVANDDCVTAGSDNGSIQVTVAAAVAAALPAATYTGTLTLLVAPI